MERGLFLCIVAIGLFACPAFAEDPVHFPDANLKTAVEAQLGIPNPTPTDLQGLTVLTAPNRNITDLTGLEYATNLGATDLTGNNIEDISAFSGLPRLIELLLQGNRIHDLSPLSGSAYLYRLLLARNDISDISDLASMPQLALVSLNDNDITDISPLCGLTNMVELNLRDNQIEDVSPLTEMRRLAICDVSENPLNRDAYCTDLFTIYNNNPGLYFFYTYNHHSPLNVSASDGTYSDRVRVTWDALCAGPIKDMRYIVYRALSANGTKVRMTGAQSGTSFNDTSVHAGQSYYYWVQGTPYDTWEIPSDADYSTPDAGYITGTPKTLTISSSAGGTVTTPGEGTFSYNQNTSVSIVAAAEPGYEFNGWSGTAVAAGKVADLDAASTTVTVDADYMLVANFAPGPHVLTLSSTTGGAVTTPGEGALSYNHNRAVLITATPETGYQFSGWAGTAVTAGKVSDPGAVSTTVTMDGDYTLIAGFAQGPRVLTISSTEGGSVTTPGEGSITYEYSTSVPVVATPKTGYHFTRWSGTAVTAGKVAKFNAVATTVTVHDDYTLVANFSDSQHTLTVSSTTGGSVSDPGEGTFQYDDGETVLLQAAPDAGYHFVRWSGNFSTNENPATIEMDGNYRVTANFAPNQHVLTVSSGEGGSVVVPGEGDFSCASGNEIRAVAVPDNGYCFAGWSGTLVTDGLVADPNANRLDVVIVANATLHAQFAPTIRSVYVDDDAPADSVPGDPCTSDPDEDGTWDHPFDTIQEAIDATGDGQAVLVLPGIYRENLYIPGKRITLSSVDPQQLGMIGQTTIHGGNLGSVVTFESDAGPDAILTGFTITGGYAEFGGGICCIDAGPVIANCVIAGNRADVGGGLYLEDSNATLVNCTVADNLAAVNGGGIHCTGNVALTNSILWGNEPQQILADPCEALTAMYSDVQGGWTGTEIIDLDPCFAVPGDPNDPETTWASGDYHLQSQYGRWEPTESTWVIDDLTSPCIDAGNPHADLKAEPAPNDGRINAGAFGGTAEASRSQPKQTDG